MRTEIDITKEELIEKINYDLQWEYAAAIQYIQHQSIISGAQYNNIRDELAIHVNEEIQHAIQLADQIDYLGGEPEIKVEEIKTSNDPKEMLKQDLQGEREAIERYKKRIKQSKSLDEYATAETIKNILVTEQEHEMDLMDALNL
ncbi:MAG: Bacterioferritin (cytochrome b1) [Candidatus Methanohalarchaeum thermophilum]|uniref:Bacterioferritin (Cytochrome b1) n=1 Tax=Methanohalarchaeum thermophilum TaxID=1903181 RepID=A0A1Q6DS97_METT1|nr:MAG: Bacterioferritin (cytochrome b1) [Candidatus Methanohalarchaeum thermophilum]